MADTTPRAEDDARITITIKRDGPGRMLASLATTGDYSSTAIDRRFYSITGAPPADITPAQFWGQLLGMIGSFMSNLYDLDEELPELSDLLRAATDAQADD